MKNVSNKVIYLYDINGISTVQVFVWWAIFKKSTNSNLRSIWNRGYNVSIETKTIVAYPFFVNL